MKSWSNKFVLPSELPGACEPSKTQSDPLSRPAIVCRPSRKISCTAQARQHDHLNYPEIYTEMRREATTKEARGHGS